MKVRPFSFVSILLAVSVFSCVSHTRGPADADKAVPSAAKKGVAVGAKATAAASRPSAPSRATAVASRPGGIESSSSNTAAAARAQEQAQAMAQGGGPLVVQAVAFGESPAVRDLPPVVAETDLTSSGEEKEGPENPVIRRSIPSESATAAKPRDTALQTELAINSIPGPILSFDGVGFSANGAQAGLSPPDTDGAVGPNHYVQQVNIVVQVFSKTGASLAGPFRLSSLFSGIGGQCAAADQGDPIVLYDQLSDRWLLSQFGFTALNAPPYHQCVAISKTPDPTGAYFVYDFVTAGNEFPDYPKLGVWPDGYYMMVHQFTLGGPFNGTGFYAFDRKKMLAGDATASYIYFNFNLASHPEGVGGSLPSNVDGLTPPPPGRPNTFAYFTTTHFGDPKDGLRLFDFHADFANPGLSTFTERPESTYANPILVAAFDPTTPTGNNGRRAVPQPSVTGVNQLNTSVDAITDRLLHRMVYRNFGDHESLVLNHTVGAPASTTFLTFRPGVRYYELRRPLPGGNFAINEQATYAPADGVSRWMGSIGMDGGGNIGLGFSVSNGLASTNPSAVFPGVRYAGRLASDPPGGLFQGENTLVNGTGVQRSTGNRWGDYSAMTIDPTDDCTFWYTQEYYTAASQAASTAGWLTRIGSFKVNPGCTAPPKGTLSGTVTYCDTGVPAVGALVEISDGHTAPVTAAGTYSITLSPGTYTVHVTGPSCIPTSPATVTVTNGGTTTYNACLSGSPNLVFKSVAVSGGNGNGVIDRNECNRLLVTLGNVGCALDTGISATLSSTTPGVTITQPNSPYPNIPEGGSATNTIPFEVSTSPTFACGTPINFTEAVNDSTGAHSFSFSLPTCTAPPVTFSGSIDLTDPTQNLRIFRDGASSVCASPKAACPGTTGAGTRHYDSYTVTNLGGVSACVTVDVSGPCSAGGGSGLNIFSTAYLGSFNPANICQNYLADEGASFAGTGSYSFNLPAGQSAVLVVNEVNQNQLCSAYSLKVSGLLANTDGGGECPRLTTSVSTSSLWPPNHNLVNVGLTATATGDCPGPKTIQVSVFGDEDDLSDAGDGNFSPDAKDIAVGTLRLRSERDGNGDGRVYLIVVKATDACGTVVTCNTVVVPHDQSASSISAVNAQAAAAKAYCEAHAGAPPPGYFVIGDGPIVGPKQ